ncbi:hypothetical protein [Mycoplasma sp. Mirounga ES2805-ORL]|uniref:hypothetical protein n=1 Tax=Mycoplasma sp. Mirounga ES2805-ORL TaxID=754514 RepID=UPI00197B981D|nr:hypothetical protein [Mycoplasma sp. Mirounga ES2805-ORL]QSF13500.1 hypothetical protein JXZ90_02375 [Mycoplasma sp. Mirounga ES2805-ORL]
MLLAIIATTKNIIKINADNIVHNPDIDKDLDFLMVGIQGFEVTVETIAKIIATIKTIKLNNVGFWGLPKINDIKPKNKLTKSRIAEDKEIDLVLLSYIFFYSYK